MLMTLPFLPISVNQCYRTKNNRIYKSKKLILFEKAVTEFFENLEKFEMLKGNISIDITFELKSFRKRDLDNLLKSLFDSLEGRVFDNDHQIFEIKCQKVHGCFADKTIINIGEL